jgi:hypothetical protein
MKRFPDQRPGEDVETYAKRTWDADLAIREEFANDFDCYYSYCKAESAGRVRILRGPVKKSLS